MKLIDVTYFDEDSLKEKFTKVYKYLSSLRKDVNYATGHINRLTSVRNLETNNTSIEVSFNIQLDEDREATGNNYIFYNFFVGHVVICSVVLSIDEIDQEGGIYD